MISTYVCLCIVSVILGLENQTERSSKQPGLDTVLYLIINWDSGNCLLPLHTALQFLIEIKHNAISTNNVLLKF